MFYNSLMAFQRFNGIFYDQNFRILRGFLIIGIFEEFSNSCRIFEFSMKFLSVEYRRIRLSLRNFINFRQNSNRASATSFLLPRIYQLVSRRSIEKSSKMRLFAKFAQQSSSTMFSDSSKRTFNGESSTLYPILECQQRRKNSFEEWRHGGRPTIPRYEFRRILRRCTVRNSTPTSLAPRTHAHVHTLAQREVTCVRKSMNDITIVETSGVDPGPVHYQCTTFPPPERLFLPNNAASYTYALSLYEKRANFSHGFIMVQKNETINRRID